MTLLHLAGFSASILIGVSLGLIGGGGSILTLPVLVYLWGINPVVSTAYSLFVVGTTSLVGSVNYMRQQQVNYKAAAVVCRSLLSGRFPDPQVPGPGHSRSRFLYHRCVCTE